MAKDASFDIISEVDLQEVDNAYQQTVRELSQRYDLKGSGATVDFSKVDGTFTVEAPSEFVAGQVVDVLNGRLAKRKVDLKSLRWDVDQAASGGSLRRVGHLVQGIDSEVAKRISKDIRDLKLKVKVTIEGDKLRVSSASRDTLQEVITFLRSSDYGQPLSYENYR
jgi:uncharacterized protein YajQ (UPF0234 family)